MSDDFFIDEDEPAKPAPKRGQQAAKAPHPAAKRPAVKGAASAAGGSIFEQDVSLTVAALIAVIALLLGMIIGLVIPHGSTAADTAATTSSSTSAGTTSNGSAPTLTQQQLDSGSLPAGHPDISGMTTTGTATSTSSSK